MKIKKMTNKLTYSDLKFPFYRNSRLAFANLTVSDLAKAAVLAPLNLFLVGDTGTGKTQLAEDIYFHYFGGNKIEGGEGVFIRAHPEIDIYSEIFTNLNIQRAERELTKNLEAMVYRVEELNRAPPVAQNQFFGLGDGSMDNKGRTIELGKDGYFILIATANLGNGEFQGTFHTDKAMYNRLHVSLDFDYEGLKPTKEDKIKLNRQKANPNVKRSRLRDISAKIQEASREIDEASGELGLEAMAVIDYLTFGLDNCQKNAKENKGSTKGKIWPVNCQDCSFNPQSNALCSLVRTPTRRTINSVVKYATALQYLSRLKDPDVQIDPADLIFKSFELAGAYQFLLNPSVLKQSHNDENPVMMAKVVEKLKDDFRANEDYVLSAYEQAERGRKVTVFFKKGDMIGNYDDLSDEAKAKVTQLEPFTDRREVGLSYVGKVVDEVIKEKSEDKDKNDLPEE